MSKACSFFGHRTIEETPELVQRLRNEIVKLIENDGVNVFLFGSRSDFNELCHKIVSELRGFYPDIKRIGYPCRSEVFVLEKDRERIEQTHFSVTKQEVHFYGVEEEVEYKDRWAAGKGQYVQRNQAMIDDSDYCIFYYNEEYLPPKRKQSKRNISDYQPKSGTKIIFDYAIQQSKKRDLTIINVYELNN